MPCAAKGCEHLAERVKDENLVRWRVPRVLTDQVNGHVDNGSAKRGRDTLKDAVVRSGTKGKCC